MRRIKKFLVVFVIVNAVVFLVHFNQSEATDYIGDINKGASGFIERGESEATGFNTGTIIREFTGLGQFLTMIGAGVYVGVVAFMGIRYMTSSPDKQATLKQQLIGVVVSGIVIFGAYGIWKAVIGVVSNF